MPPAVIPMIKIIPDGDFYQSDPTGQVPARIFAVIRLQTEGIDTEPSFHNKAALRTLNIKAATG